MGRLVSGLLLGAVVAASLGAVDPAPAAPPSSTAAVQPPNIILITTDDQRLSDLSVMPQTRRLLGQAGIRFTSGLSPHPVCCPARAEILTGQYAQNNGVRSTGGINGGFPALRSPHNTIGPWLQDAGYRTGLVGKFLLKYSWGRDGAQPGWDWWDPTIVGVHAYTSFTQANNGEPVAVTDGYITDYVDGRVRDLVDAWAPGDRPFFIWESFVAPHEAILPGDSRLSRPPIPAPEYAGTRAGIPNIALSAPSFNEADVSDKPGRIQRRPLYGQAGIDRLQAVFEGRQEALQSVDDAVAGLVQHLDDLGELDNTLIIFTSDNGFLLGEHRYLGKLFGYEEALRVPLLMRGPGIAPRQVSDRVVTTTDIAPTILEAAGATPGRRVAGRSVLDAGSADTYAADQAVLIQAGNKNRARVGQPGWWFRGVRIGRYTYTRWYDGFEELYDRKRDPSQLTNIADEPAFLPVLLTLRQTTSTLQWCRGPRACNPRVILPPVLH